MTQPCIQGERVAKLEANNEAIMKELSEMKQTQKEMGSDLKEVKGMLTDFILAANKEFAKKSDVESLQERQTSVETKISNQASFVKGIGWVLGTFGATLLGLIIAFAKLVIKAF